MATPLSTSIIEKIHDLETHWTVLSTEHDTKVSVELAKHASELCGFPMRDITTRMGNPEPFSVLRRCHVEHHDLNMTELSSVTWILDLLGVSQFGAAELNLAVADPDRKYEQDQHEQASNWHASAFPWAFQCSRVNGEPHLVETNPIRVKELIRKLAAPDASDDASIISRLSTHASTLLPDPKPHSIPDESALRIKMGVAAWLARQTFFGRGLSVDFAFSANLCRYAIRLGRLNQTHRLRPIVSPHANFILSYYTRTAAAGCQKDMKWSRELGLYSFPYATAHLINMAARFGWISPVQRVHGLVALRKAFEEADLEWSKYVPNEEILYLTTTPSCGFPVPLSADSSCPDCVPDIHRDQSWRSAEFTAPDDVATHRNTFNLPCAAQHSLYRIMYRILHRMHAAKSLSSLLKLPVQLTWPDSPDSIFATQYAAAAAGADDDELSRLQDIDVSKIIMSPSSVEDHRSSCNTSDDRKGDVVTFTEWDSDALYMFAWNCHKNYSVWSYGDIGTILSSLCYSAGAVHNMFQCLHGYGMMIDLGWCDSSPNSELGSDIYEHALQSVQTNYCRTQHNLALSYDTGKGRTKDFAEAVRLYQLAVDSGYHPAATNLGIAYQEGEGVEVDIAKALEFFKRSLSDARGIISFASRTIMPDTKTYVLAPTSQVMDGLRFMEWAAEIQSEHGILALATYLLALYPSHVPAALEEDELPTESLQAAKNRQRCARAIAALEYLCSCRDSSAIDALASLYEDGYVVGTKDPQKAAALRSIVARRIFPLCLHPRAGRHSPFYRVALSSRLFDRHLVAEICKWLG
jgi:TPR repeat protein